MDMVEKKEKKINQKGFTLLELMIVIIVLSVLVLILVPNFVVVRNQAKMSACQSNLKTIATAVEIYASLNRDQYPNSNFTVNQSCIIWDYLGKDLKCPSIKLHYEYKISTSNSKYWVYCPTVNNTIKHKTSYGTVDKIYFDNQEGIKIQY